MRLEQISSLDPLPHNVLAPFQAICKGQSLQPNIAQFTLVFWIHFPFMRKPQPRLNGSCRKCLWWPLARHLPALGSRLPQGRRWQGPAQGKQHRRSGLWVARPFLPLQRPAPAAPPLPSWMSGTLD